MTATTPPIKWVTSSRTGLLPYLGFTTLATLLSGLVPFLLVSQVPDVGRSGAWALTLLVMVWSGVRLSLLIVIGRPMLFDFFFLMFLYVFMGMGPAVQIRSGEIAGTTPGMDPALDFPTAGLICLGVVCYEVGRLLHFLRSRRPAGAAMSSDASSRLVVSPPSSRRSLVLVAVGLALSSYFIVSVGTGSLFGSREQAFAARTATWPDPAIRSIVYALAIYPLLVGVGALALLRRTTRRVPPGWYQIVIIGCVVMLLIVVNPLSSARYSLGTVLFALAVFAGAAITATRVRMLLLAALAGLIFLFPLADAFRRTEVNLARDGFFGEYRGNADYDSFWQISNALSFWVDGLVEPGRQILGSLLFWIPRAIWSDKPVDTGILLAQYRGYQFENLSAPLWAEFLVNGGIVFLIAGFTATGFLLRSMDRRLLPAFAAAGYWAIVGAIFPVYMTILLRGSLLQATGAVFIAIACLLAIRGSGRARPAPLFTAGRPRQDVLRSSTFQRANE